MAVAAEKLAVREPRLADAVPDRPAWACPERLASEDALRSAGRSCARRRRCIHRTRTGLRRDHSSLLHNRLARHRLDRGRSRSSRRSSLQRRVAPELFGCAAGGATTAAGGCAGGVTTTAGGAAGFSTGGGAITAGATGLTTGGVTTTLLSAAGAAGFGATTVVSPLLEALPARPFSRALPVQQAWRQRQAAWPEARVDAAAPALSV